MTVRAGGSSSPTDWHCTGSGQVASCGIASLPAGSSGVLRVKVFLAQDAAPGAVAGTVTGADRLGAAIPSAVIQIEPK